MRVDKRPFVAHARVNGHSEKVVKVSGKELVISLGCWWSVSEKGE